jgi:aspartyl-tRNA(Asn)/glutamyl-tRNA(Gln) amidotransferase subunit C
MASLNRSDVLKLAKLARLHLTEDELVKFGDEINAILKYVEQLQALDLSEYEPTYQVTGLKNVMRKDKPIDYKASPKELLKNTPAQENGFIKVRRVLE